MSKIALKSAASGTATFTIESPATNTDRVLVLPDVAGTVLVGTQPAGDIVGTTATQTLTNKSIAATQLTGTVAAARLPAGSVLQVVSATKTDAFSTTSGSFVDVTGLAATITPSSATSKILVVVSANAGANPSGVAEFRLLRGSTEILLADSAGSRSRTSFTFYQGSGNNGAAGVGTNFLDSPSTTSATTYKITMRSNTGGQTVAVNRTQLDDDGGSTSRATSTITLMEIAA